MFRLGRFSSVVSLGHNGLSAGARLAAVGLLVAGAAGARAASTSPNTGSLGSAADGTNGDSVTFAQGVVQAGGTDRTAVYDGVAAAPGSPPTLIPYQPSLNPPSNSGFAIEFWARPVSSDDDDAPVSNRVSSGNRSGWVFFQRAATTGWNFRMYDGNGSALGWTLTGGTSNLNEWSHVVATWNGASALLYVNGQLADGTNDGGSGAYNASTSAPFLIASSDSGSPYHGAVDEVAFYGASLTAAQVQAHYDAVSSPTPGLYQELVRTDGALLQLSNNEIVPEPSAVAVVLLGAGGLVMRRRRGAQR